MEIEWFLFLGWFSSPFCSDYDGPQKEVPTAHHAPHQKNVYELMEICVHII